MIAVSVTVGIGVMVDSFRQTVVRWLETTLQSDVYASVPSRAGGFSGADLDPAVAQRALALPGVAGGHTIRRVELASPAEPVELSQLFYRCPIGSFQVLPNAGKAASREHDK